MSRTVIVVDNNNQSITDVNPFPVKLQSGGTGGGGPATIADGADIAEGATTDAESASGNASVIALLKRIRTLLSGGFPAALVGGRLDVNVGNTVTVGTHAVTIADGADTVEGALSDAAIVTDVGGSVSGKLRGVVKILASVWDSVNGRLIVSNAALAFSTVALTRPSDTNTYAAGDAVTDSTSAPSQLTFTGCGRAANKKGRIVSAVMVDSANQVTKGAFELFLFTASVTPDNDNVPFTPTDAELATCIGVIPFSTAFVGDATSGAGGNALYVSPPLDLPFLCDGTTSLFGLLVVRNVYTPVSAEVFTFNLGIEQE